jgi:hypothetical protein
MKKKHVIFLLICLAVFFTSVILVVVDYYEAKAYIDSIIKNNAEKANYYAMKTLRKVQKKVGFPERIR